MNPNTYKDEIARCVALARGAGLPVPKFGVRWTIRSRHKNGQATCRFYRSGPAKYWISLSPSVAIAAGEAYVQTVAHEVAHIVVFAMHEGEARSRHADDFNAFCTLWRTLANQRGNHGRDWKHVMGLFGRPADRCSSY